MLPPEPSLSELFAKFNSLHASVRSLSDSFARNASTVLMQNKFAEERFRKLEARLGELIDGKSNGIGLSPRLLEVTIATDDMVSDQSETDLNNVMRQQAILHSSIDNLVVQIAHVEVSQTLESLQSRFEEILCNKLDAALQRHQKVHMSSSSKPDPLNSNVDTDSAFPNESATRKSTNSHEVDEPGDEERRQKSVLDHPTSGLSQESQESTGETESRFRQSFGFMLVSSAGSSLTSTVKTIVNNRWFATAVVLAIICQSSLLGLQVNRAMSRQRQRYEDRTDDAVGDEAIFEVINGVFTVFWGVEVILRMFALRHDFFIGHHKGWNCFDLLLAILAVAELTGPVSSSVSFLRSVRILRMIRVLKILHIFQELRRMIYALLHCMRSLFWLGILLVVMLYTFSLAFMQGALNYLADLNPSNHEHIEVLQDLEKEHLIGMTLLRFKSIPEAMYSLFAAITGGTEWTELLKALSAHSFLMGLLSLFFVLFFIFGVMNVVTGVFVDIAMQITNSDMEEQMEAKKREHEAYEKSVRQLIRVGDEDGKGFLSRREVRTLLRNQSVQHWLAAIGVTVSDSNVKDVLGLLDPKHSNQISYDTFFHVIESLTGQASAVDLTILLHEFRQHHGVFTQHKEEVQQMHMTHHRHLTELHSQIINSS